jgi:prephenate dehydrogenase
MIERLCIIGVGLIGGSLARAARAAGVCREVVGAGRNADNLRLAVELGVIDRYETDAGAAVQGADMVVVAVPLGAIRDVFKAIGGHLMPGAVVTDVASAKASVVEDARQAFGEVPSWFVPAHPIAGTEQSGVAASFASLFQQRRVILTPLPQTDARACARVRALWQAAGAEVMEMPVAHHDEVLAATSHLPHLLAYTLVDSLARLDDSEEIFQYAAGGFRDFTRIAGSDPVMWRDICLANRQAILAMLEHFSDDLAMLRDAITAGDGPRMLEIFARAKRARNRYAHRHTQRQDQDEAS